MAHAVRPESYLEINNFYTPTVYDKGAEVVRMMQTLVGREGFARGLALYFERHDGQAVTCDDFAQAVADANPGSPMAARLPQFKRWYAQAGTPRVTARGRYDAPTRTYTLGFEQHGAAPSGPGTAQAPFVIPMAMGLLARDGRALPLQLEDEPATPTPTFERVLVLDETKNFFTFVNVDADPVPSLLRGFSAPVAMADGLGDAELLILLQHDSDPFSRWEAGQRMALNRILTALRAGQEPQLDAPFAQAMQDVLRDSQLDAAFKELLLSLPSEGYIAEQLAEVDPPRVHAVRRALRLQLAQALRDDWASAHVAHRAGGVYSPDHASAGKRSLSALALSMLCLDAGQRGDPLWPRRAFESVKDAPNLTESLGALTALIESRSDLAEPALAHVYERFRGETLVIDKWFSAQACMPEHDGSVFARVRQLTRHPDFSMKNPNRARSLIGAFCHGNPGAFHRADAAGYVFWADRVLEMDAINPQVASRLARALDRWNVLVEPLRNAAREALARVAAKPDLSNDVREIVEHALGPSA